MDSKKHSDLRQNLLVLLIDDLRADRCLPERRRGSTPLVEYLIKNGTMFTQAISVTSFTTPSVASILTGTYPFHHGIEWFSGNKLSTGCLTMASILKKAGYSTCALVTGPLGPQLGLDIDFDYYLFRSEKKTIYKGFKKQFEDYLKKLTEPWFIFAHLWELHYPIYLPPDLSKRGSLSFEKYDLAFSHLNQQLMPILRTIDLDKTMVVFLSDHGERLPSNLESVQRNLSAGLKNSVNPIVWFKLTKRLFEIFPSLREKQGHGFHLYEPLVRIPLIFAGSGFPRNQIVDDQVSQVDILPTILENLNLSIPANTPFHGRSLCSTMHNDEKKEQSERCIYLGPAGIFDGLAMEQKSGWIEGLRTPKWKYISLYNKNKAVELYSLQDDPNEIHNVVDDRTEIASGFTRKLHKIKSGKTSNSPIHAQMTPEEKQKIEERLKALGYID